jgi:hypothetical protein
LDRSGKQLQARSIDSTAAAVAISMAAGNQLSVGASGGGASAYNTILGDTSATISSPSIVSAGNVSVAANAPGTIKANIIGIAAAASGSATSAGGAVSIGASVARNLIGASQSDISLPEGKPVLLNGGDGNRLTASISGPSTTGLNVLSANGTINVQTNHNSVINASVIAVSAAAAAGSRGALALSGAGSEATNIIATTSNAFVIGKTTSNSATLKSDNLTIKTGDASSIDATAVGAGLSNSFGLSGSIAGSIGVSLASNVIIRNSKAELANSDSILPFNMLSAGNISVSSASVGSINSKSIAAAISAAVGNGFSGGLAGGGAHSFNVITGNSQALITSANVGTNRVFWNGNLEVINSDTTSIDATVDSIAAGAAIGENALSVAIGVGFARNFIGEMQGDRHQRGGEPVAFRNVLGGSGNLVRAAVTDSNLFTLGTTSIKAINSTSITSNVTSSAAALSLSVSNGGSLVGAGSEATNRSLLELQSFLGGSSNKTITIDSGALMVTGTDFSSLDALLQVLPWLRVFVVLERGPPVLEFPQRTTL